MLPKTPASRGMAVAAAVVLAVLAIPILAVAIVAGILGILAFLLFYIGARAIAGVNSVCERITGVFSTDGRENVRVIRRE